MSHFAAISVLFTDLVDSTGILSRLGPRAAEELRRVHFGLLRDPIAATGGAEVKNLGDGLMVVFDAPSTALHCAVGMQRALHAHNQDTSEPLLVRIGVSHGEAQLAEGDYFGPPVVEAARLCAMAQGRQILTSELVCTVVGSRGGFEFVAQGDLELKGLTQPVGVYLVEWAIGADQARPAVEEPAFPLPGRLDQPRPLLFQGRAAERAVLAAAYKSVVGDGRRRLALVSGEPGIGKTRLALHVATEAYESGAVVLYGHCDPELGGPYAPFVEALGHLVAHAPRKVIAAHVDRHGGELSRLLPELPRRFPGLPRPGSSDPEVERHLMFAAVGGLIDAASRRAPVVLVLDDLQWADRGTLILLKYLVTESRQSRLLILATYREDELPRDHPLRTVLAELYREQDIDRLRLSGLDEDELVGLIEDAVGAPLGRDGQAIARMVHRETDGNVFFATEILRHLAEAGLAHLSDGKWSLDPDVPFQLPRSIHDVVGLRVARLGEEVRRVLVAASVLGREFDLELLATVTSVDEDRLVDVLDGAIHAALIVPVPEAHDRYMFTHGLIQHTLYDELNPSRRQRLHRRAAEALGYLCGDEPGDRVGELAHHWSHANKALDEAVHYAELAGCRALDRLAPQEATHWFGRALDRLGQDATERRCRLLIGLGDAERQAGDPAHRETLLTASKMAASLGDTALLVRAVLANSRGMTSSAGVLDAERVEMLQQAQHMLGDTASPSLALVLSHLAIEEVYGDRFVSERLSDEAVAMAREVSEPRTLAWALTLTSGARLGPDTLAARLAASSEAVALAESLEDPALRWHAALGRYLAVMDAGEVVEADRQLAGMEQIATHTRQAFFVWYSMYVRAEREILAGRLVEAEALANDALGIGLQSGQPDALLFYGGSLFQLRRQQGRADELTEILEQAMQATPELTVLRAALASIYCELGRGADAGRIYELDAAQQFTTVRRDASWLPSLVEFGAVAAHLQDVASCRLILERLEPYRSRLVCGGPACTGPIELYLGVMSAAVGRLVEAEAEFVAAIETADRIGAPFWAGRARLGLARARRARGLSHDDYRPLVLDALRMGDAIGAAALTRQATAMLEQ